MKLILFRHAIAEKKTVVCGKVVHDADRKLVSAGIKKQTKVNRQLKKKFEKIDAIFSSPLVRAQQTARLIQNDFSSSPIINTDCLLPSCSLDKTLTWLKKNASKLDWVMLVGHEPHLSLFAGFLLTGKVESFIKLKKSGFIILGIESLSQFKPSDATLLEVYSPSALD